MSLFNSVRDMLAQRIAGEIVLSANPGTTMRKWRVLMQVSQVELANELGLSPSVVSDYETGRRRSPGSGFIRRFVDALISIDEMQGGKYVQQLARITLTPGDAFLDIRELSAPIPLSEICDLLKCDVLTGESSLDQNVFGYTVIDSLKAIQMLSGLDFYRIFGSTSERALVFVRVSRGRSPMIAIKISPFKPRIVILHGASGDIDPLAIALAKNEGIPLAVSNLGTPDDIVEALLQIYERTQG
ncbi:MAG TPA: helix-turn-helix domain-containing protein [Patescibacteria group bacterium]|nr:helix-turn-helix domain-containing protein [Patescibacteria group bacterium]